MKTNKMNIEKIKFIENYTNRIIPFDVIKVLRYLPDNCIDLIYADADYNVGIDYAGEKYTKKWDEYVFWYCDLMKESMRVLKDNGNLFTFNYPKQNAYLRVNLLDKISFNVHEYVWVYNSNVGHSNRNFTRAHRSILHATKSKSNNFYKDQVAEPYKNPTDKRIKDRIQNGSNGRMPYSWFYYDLVKNVSKEKTSHPCQIPLNLVKMLFNATTKPNDTIFILFGGSGAEINLAKKMKRNFLSCEINKEYYKNILNQLEEKQNK